MTRNEASYREKGRSLFLAALMVMSVFAMSAAFAGSATAATNKENLDGDYYQGQDLEVSGFNDSEFVQIRQGTLQESERVDIAQADSNGVLTYDTSDLDEGPYVLREDSTGDDYGPFVIEVQDFDASFSTTEVEQNHNGTLEITSENRDTESFDVTITGTFNGETLTAEELGEIFDNDTANADEDSVGITVNHDQDLNANLADSELGDYEFTVDVDDTTAQSTATVTVVEEAETNIEFADSTMQSTQGDIAEIVLDVENADQAYIELEEDYDVDPFWANFNISVDEDLEDDEQVTVKFNTYNAGNTEPVVEVENGELGDYEESDFDGRLPAHSYDLTVFEQESDQVREDAAILTLSEPSVGDASSSIAPGATDTTDAEEIVDAKSDLDNVADGDYAIVEVEATGIFGYWAENSEFNNSDQLNVTLDTVATDRSGEPRESSTDYRVVPDANNDRFFVVVDASDLSSSDYDDWEVTFTANESYAYFGDEEQSASSTFTVEERNLKFDINSGDQYQVTMDGDNAWEVRGSSTALAPGTEVTVTASSSLFLESETVEIQADSDGDRYFVANFADDINDEEVELGHEFTLRAEAASLEDVEETGVVSEVPEWETSASAEELEELLEDYEVDSVQDLRDLISSLEEDSDALNQLLEDNEVESAEELQALIDDLETENEELQTENEELQTENEDLNSQIEDLNSQIEDLEQQLEDAQKKGSDDGSSDDGKDDSSDDGTPGFGVAVAAVALLAAAMLALRRQH